MGNPPGPEDRSEPESEEAAGDEDVIGEIEPEEAVEEQPPEARTRPRRRRSRLIGCVLALLGAIAGGALAWWISSDALTNRQDTAPAVDEAPGAPGDLPSNSLLFSPTPDRPEQTPEIISAETDVIYAFYDLGRLPADAPLTATWSHDGEALGDLPLVDHERHEDAGHARGRFVIRPPSLESAAGSAQGAAEGFPAGIYEVEIASPEQPDITAESSFVALPRAAQVLQGGGEPEGPPVIRSLQTATEVTDEGEAVDQSSVFPPGTDRIVAVFTYEGVAPGSVLTVRWHVGDEEIERGRAEIPVTAAEGWATAWLEAGDADELPAGQYQVTVHLGDDDQRLASTGFEIRAENADGPPAD